MSRVFNPSELPSIAKETLAVFGQKKFDYQALLVARSFLINIMQEMTAEEMAIQEANYSIGIGALLGECIIARYGGYWEHDKVIIKPKTKTKNDRIIADPIGKVVKNIRFGASDDFICLYHSIETLLAQMFDVHV